MNDLAPLPAYGLSSPAEAFEDLEEIRARLVRAQRAENLAIRKLNALATRTKADRLAFERLMAQARETRARAIDAYETWKHTVERINGEALARSRGDS